MTYTKLIIEIESIAMTYSHDSKERDILMKASNVITYLIEEGKRK